MIRNMKSCCIICNRKIDDLKKYEIRNKLIYLIENFNISIFNFGFYGEFNDLCYELLVELKNRYSKIKLVLFSLNNEIAYTFDEVDRVKKKPFSNKCFDEIIYLEDVDETKFKYACVLRNKKLVDESDFCFIYYKESYSLPNNRNSGTKIAFEYAKKQNKFIVLYN